MTSASCHSCCNEYKRGNTAESYGSLNTTGVHLYFQEKGLGVREKKKVIIIILPIIKFVARKRSITDPAFSYKSILLFSIL